jgi:isochorismate synthase
MPGYSTVSFEISDSQFEQAFLLAARNGVVHSTSEETFLGFGALRFDSADHGEDLATSRVLRLLGSLQSEDPLFAPRAHLAVPFFVTEPWLLVVPRIQILRRGSKIDAIIVQDSPATSHQILEDFFQSLEDHSGSEIELPTVQRVTETPTSIDYGEQVKSALKHLTASEAQKVVLARSLQIELSEALDAGGVLVRMREREPSCSLYGFSISETTRMVGASPELLLSRKGSTISSNPLAGTVSLGDDANPDHALTESEKDLEEHRLVVEAISNGLRGSTDSLEVPDTPSLVTLRSVAHLGTLITGELRDPHTETLIDLLRSIHPTPAIAGVPRAAALAIISQLESFQRGFFGGAVGWINGSGDGELVLAIRGVILEANSVTISAGAGVVSGSSPEGERKEILAKLRSIIDAALPAMVSSLTK